MTNTWHGVDPSAQADPSAYELGQVWVALRALSLTGIRVWSPVNAIDRAGRNGHIWAMDGTLQVTVPMTTALPSGWSTHPLTVPLAVNAGDFLVLSYETNGNYGAVNAAFSGAAPQVAVDGATEFPQAAAIAGINGVGHGRFRTTPGLFPTSVGNNAFYGVDAVYTLVGAGTAPTITSVLTSTDGLNVTLTFAATDPEGLGGATYAVNWGDGQTSAGATGVFSHTYAANGIYGLLVSVTDSTGLAGYASAAVEALGAGGGLGVAAITAMIESHALRLGIFQQVNTHEPKNAPSGLVASIWAAYLGPAPRQSGLTSTTALLIFSIRITTNMLGEPQDGIDVMILNAVDALMSAYSGDFDLGGTVRDVDLLGISGTPLAANAGYLSQDNKMLRTMVITLPLIVNDVWSQAS